MAEEIFTEIFLYAFIVTMDMDSGPWCLARVCRRWRERILSTPRLWTRIDIQLYGPSMMVFGRAQAMQLKTILEKSKSLPLSICFYASDGMFFSAFLDLLMAESERWKSVNLTLPNQLLMRLSDPQCGICSKTPILKSVRVGRELSESGEVVAQPIRAFLCAPMLITVRLENISAREFEIPWEQIVELDTSPNMDDDQDVIRQTTQLIDYTHTSHAAFDMEPLMHADSYDIRLDTVRTLCLIGHAGSGTQLLLPNLERALFIMHDNFPLSLAAALLQRSQCPLTKLSLFGHFTTGNFVIQILAAVPTLEELYMAPRTHVWGARIFEDGMRDKLLGKLTSSRQERCLVPRLQVLVWDVDVLRGPAFEWSLVRKLWESRQTITCDKEDNRFGVWLLQRLVVTDHYCIMSNGEVSDVS